VLAALRAMPPGWILVGVGVYCAAQSLCVWRWSLLAGALELSLPYRTFWHAYFGGMFASLALPSCVGGDLLRVLVVARPVGDRTRAIVSVLADRGVGLLVLTGTAALGAILSPGMLPAAVNLLLWILAGLLGLGFLLPFLTHPRGSSVYLVGIAARCWRSPARLLGAVVCGSLFQVALLAIFQLLGHGLGLAVTPAQYLVICPLTSLASMLPFTLHGIGERTAMLVFLFGLVGVEQERAVAFGLAWTAVTTLASLVGAVTLTSPEWRAATEPPH